MNSKNRFLIRYALWLADMIVVVAAFFLGTWLRFFNFRDMEDKALHFYVCLVFVFAGTVYTFARDYNRDFLKRTFWKEGTAVLEYEFASVLGTVVLIYALDLADTFSRLVMGYYAILGTIITLLTHQLVKRILQIYWQGGDSAVKILIISTEANLKEVIRQLSDSIDINYHITGAVCLDRDLSGQEIESVPVVTDRESLLLAAQRMPLDEVFIYTPDMPQSQMGDVIDAFNEMGLTVHYCVELPGMAGSSQMGSLGTFPVVSYTRGTGRYRALIWKRVLDITGALVGLVITGIMFPFIALAVKADSPGPVLFSQTRIGRGGRRFRIYKFRTMVRDAEQMKKELEAQNEMSGPIFKISDDPRVTRVGAFLRKTSLDEFPQFWNVLKGDMSLVGTRPPTEEEFVNYSKHYRRRISMTPGLTGMWQVSGRSTIDDFEEIVRLDLLYIDNWSLGLDLRILIKTVGVVLFRRGAK